MKRIRKALKQPATLRDLMVFGLAIILGAVSFLLMGAKGADPKMVYRAATLNPAPIATEKPVLVKTEVIKEPVPSPAETPQITPDSPIKSGGGGELSGSIGYAIPGGNCILEPGVNNPGYGNPISWPILSGTPSIGATALFTFNHTGVVTGIWSNGDIEIRHQNYSGSQHRFPVSAFRGFR